MQWAKRPFERVDDRTYLVVTSQKFVARQLKTADNEIVESVSIRQEKDKLIGILKDVFEKKRQLKSHGKRFATNSAFTLLVGLLANEDAGLRAAEWRERKIVQGYINVSYNRVAVRCGGDDCAETLRSLVDLNEVLFIDYQPIYATRLRGEGIDF